MSETPDFDENEESSGLTGTILGMVKPVLKPLVSTIESLTRISTGGKRTAEGINKQSATGPDTNQRKARSHTTQQQSVYN